jgi:O-antigen/teichoic acid export membrane protein
MLVSNHQSQAALFLAGSMVVNMILNLLLVPWLGISGAATARLISALFFFLPNFLFVFRHIQPIKFSLGFLKPVAATLGMVGIVWWVQDLPLPLVVALGGILYLILLLSFRIISPDERRLLGSVFHHSILGNVEDVL